LTESNQPQPENDQTPANDCPWSIPVDHPALDRPEQTAFESGKGKGSGQQRLAPAEFILYQKKVSTECLKEQDGSRELNKAAGANHPPTPKYVTLWTEDLV
jgi:hypothetical protein